MTRADEGRSLLELLAMVALLSTAVAIAIPRGWELTQEYRLRGASLYMRSLIRQVRAYAAAKNTYVGLVFEEVDGEPLLAVHVDGNGNGIRRVDVQSGVDKRVRGPWRLSRLFPGVRYGSAPRGSAPEFPRLRIGRSKILSFSPLGQSTSGTLFLSNDFGSVHAVVVLGATGRVRVARYRRGQWESYS